MKKFEISINEVEQGSVKNILQSGEEILWQGTPYKKAFVLEPFLKFMPIALFWLALDVIMIVIMFKFIFSQSVGNPMQYVVIPFFFIHLVPVWIWLGSLIKKSLEHKNVEYVVTDRRIVIRRGIIGIDFLSLFYSDVEGVTVRVSFLDRLFKVGDLFIVAKQTKAMISDIKDPYSVYQLIQKVSLDMRTDISYPNALRPNVNNGYTTSYNPNGEEDGDNSNGNNHKG